MHTDLPNESLYEALVQASPDAIIYMDFSGLIRIANPRAAEMCGFDSPERMIGLNLFSFFSGPEKKSVAESFEKIKSNTPAGIIEATIVCNGGSKFIAEISGSVVRDGKKNPTGLICLIRDVTGRKAREKQLAHAKNNADKTNQLKDAFISNISYEIRTPLNAIVGFTELIREETEDIMSEDISSYFSIIDISCDRLIQGVEMILNLSRMQSGIHAPEKNPVNPDQVLRDLVARHQPLAMQKSLTLTFENICGEVQLMTDINCISQPVSIILDNAIKFTNKGSIRVVLARDTKKRVLIEISDTGIGMRPDYMDGIFEPLSQEEHKARHFAGLGLSLAIAKKLLETIGAEISVVSRHGEGSVFTVILPGS